MKIIYVITYSYFDKSASGIICAFENKVAAEAVFSSFIGHGDSSKTFFLETINLL
jgi:hypothetical protein